MGRRARTPTATSPSVEGVSRLWSCTSLRGSPVRGAVSGDGRPPMCVCGVRDVGIDFVTVRPTCQATALPGTSCSETRRGGTTHRKARAHPRPCHIRTTTTTYRTLRAARRPLPFARATSRGGTLRTTPQLREAKDAASTAHARAARRAAAHGTPPAAPQRTHCAQRAGRVRSRARRRTPPHSARRRNVARRRPRRTSRSRIRRTSSRRSRARVVVQDEPTHEKW